MNKQLVGLLIVLLAPCVQAQRGVSVTVDIHQPGVYGRITLGDVPPPVVMPQPVIVLPPVHVQQQPIYLYVPPGHQRKWAKHCRQYNACGQPVYFVREEWVREQYEHEHPQRKPKMHGRGHGHGRDH